MNATTQFLTLAHPVDMERDIHHSTLKRQFIHEKLIKLLANSLSDQRTVAKWLVNERHETKDKKHLPTKNTKGTKKTNNTITFVFVLFVLFVTFVTFVDNCFF